MFSFRHVVIAFFIGAVLMLMSVAFSNAVLQHGVAGDDADKHIEEARQHLRAARAHLDAAERLRARPRIDIY